MRLLRNSFLAFAVISVCSSAHLADASTITFSGTFAQDNSKFLLTVDIQTPSTFTAETTSFALGGFDPILTLYAPDGTFLTNNDDRDFFAGELDSLIDPLVLSPGQYSLVLTQYDNFGQATLAAGFDHDGTPSFTMDLCIAFGACDPASPPPCSEFVDASGNCRTNSFSGDFAVTPVETEVPEPGTLMLVASALVGTMARGRVKRWTAMGRRRAP